MATEIGALSLRLHVDPAGLQRGFAAAEARLKKFGDFMQGGIPVVRKFASELRSVGGAVEHALEEPIERLIEAMRSLQAAFERVSVAAEGRGLGLFTKGLDKLLLGIERAIDMLPDPLNKFGDTIVAALGIGSAAMLALASLYAAFLVLGAPFTIVIAAVAFFAAVVVVYFDEIMVGVDMLKDAFWALWEVVSKRFTEMVASAVAMKDDVVTAVRETYLGIKEWLVDKLSPLVDLVRKPVTAIVDLYKWARDKIVTRSYVPDMIDGIERQFGRLDGAMVRPVESATEAIAASFEDMASSVADGLGSMVRQGTTELSDFKEFALKTATDIVGTLARTLGRIGGQALANAFAPAAGGGLVGSYDADVTHRGGVIGATSFPTRRVPAPVMAIAPRLHAGFAPDEFPAILQRGETVLPRGGGAVAPIRVVINDQRGAAAPPIGVRHQAGPDGLREILISVMAEDARRNGPAFRATAAALGGQRVGRSR